MPPESIGRLLVHGVAEATISRYFTACCSTCALHSGQRAAHAEFDVVERAHPGHQRVALEHHAAVQPGPRTSRPSMMTLPALASSRPASAFRMVVLPQPEWPMMQTNWPRSMPK
jgi:hypothetical protein